MGEHVFRSTPTCGVGENARFDLMVPRGVGMRKHSGQGVRRAANVSSRRTQPRPHQSHLQTLLAPGCTASRPQLLQIGHTRGCSDRRPPDYLIPRSTQYSLTCRYPNNTILSFTASRKHPDHRRSLPPPVTYDGRATTSHPGRGRHRRASGDRGRAWIRLSALPSRVRVGRTAHRGRRSYSTPEHAQVLSGLLAGVDVHVNDPRIQRAPFPAITSHANFDQPP